MSVPTIRRPDHAACDIQDLPVGAAPDPAPAKTLTSPIGPSPEQSDPSLGHKRGETHHPAAEGRQTEDRPAMFGPTNQSTCAGRSSQGADFATLAFAADILDDLEKVKNANVNRLRDLTRSGPDADGIERGLGLDESHPSVAMLAALVETLAEAEKDATRNLERLMRSHPLGLWVKAQKGVGNKQAARLLAAVGDPYWNTLHDRPRTVSELWAYCGYRPGLKRQKGIKSNWSRAAKMRAYLVAEACVKTPGSPYREVYLERRRSTGWANVGPSQYEAVGEPRMTKGHSHNDALRIVAKRVLRDLWREAKRLHEEQESRAAA